MLFRAKVHKCPSCGSYEISEEFNSKKKVDDFDASPTPPRPASTQTRTKPRLRGYVIPQTPTPLQGESAITPEMLKRNRDGQRDPNDSNDVEVEVDETPTNDDPVDQRAKVALEIERMLDDSIGTDATVEIPNPLENGLDFSSDVFLEDRNDPSVERPMPELRKDPSVEKKRPPLPKPEELDVEKFGRLPTRPTAKRPSAKKPSAKKPSAKKPSAKKPSAKKPSAKKPSADQSVVRLPKRPVQNTPAAFESRRERLELDDAVIDDALSGLDFSLRDPSAAQRDPSLILDLENPLTEEEIELARSIVKGEREVRSRPAVEPEEKSEPKIEVASDMIVGEHAETTKPPAPPRARQPVDEAADHELLPDTAAPPATPTRTRPPALPMTPDRVEPARRRESAPRAPARIGSRLSAISAVLAFGAAAAIALASSIVAVGGWACVLAAAIVGAGTALPRLGRKMELLHVIAAGAAVASTQPWALDLAQIGQTSFWRAPAAMACVGALIICVTLVIAAAERREQ